jgi:Zinc-finger containing family
VLDIYVQFIDFLSHVNLQQLAQRWQCPKWMTATFITTRLATRLVIDSQLKIRIRETVCSIQGDGCPFRHEPSALGKETVCNFWKQGKCSRLHCNFRHMDVVVSCDHS